MSPAFSSIRPIRLRPRPGSRPCYPSDQWRSRYVALAAQNLKRWNALATADRDAVIGLIAELAGRQLVRKAGLPRRQSLLSANEALAGLHQMTLAARDSVWSIPDQDSRASASSRDAGIDTMRGIAILMVIGIHSLQQPLNSWETLADASLRPCVPIFLFASGYLTALSGRVPLGKRLKAALIPYAIAFVAAYIYMALHNPAMDHRITTTLARFALAYVFVYYYVFVYVGCTFGLWLVFSASAHGRAAIGTAARCLAAAFNRAWPDCRKLSRSAAVSPGFFGLPGRGSPHARHSVLVFLHGARGAARNIRKPIQPARHAGADDRAQRCLPSLLYAAVRLFGLGDAADYNSVAFFGYAALLCVLLLALDVRLPLFATLGSGSYFIYLWHIFIVMLLRDHAGLRQFGPAANFAITYTVTARAALSPCWPSGAIAPPRLIRWLGA